MNYIQLFAKGGKINTKAIKSEIARIFMLEDSPEKVEQLWQDAVNTYGSEEGVLSEIFKQVGDNPSDESVQKAMMKVLNYTPMEESRIFKCGGKLQQLVTKFGKGGGVDCGCGGIKINQRGGVADEGGLRQQGPFYNLQSLVYRNSDGKYMGPDGAAFTTSRIATNGGNQEYTVFHPDLQSQLNDNLNTQRYMWNPRIFPVNYPHTSTFRTDPNGNVSTLNPPRAISLADTEKYQDGGLVLEQLPGHDVDTKLTRRQARDLAALNQGYNGEQFQYAMDNAMNALRKQGLRGRELRERAREMVAGISPAERSIVSAPTALNTASTIASPAEITAPEQLVLPETQRMLDSMLDRTNTSLTKSLNKPKVTTKSSDGYIRKGSNPILSYQDFNRQPGYTRRSDGQPLSYQDFTQQLGDVYVTANKSGYNRKGNESITPYQEFRHELPEVKIEDNKSGYNRIGNEPVSSYNNFIEQLPEAQVFGSKLPEVYVTANRSGYNSLPNGQPAVSYQDFRQQLPDVTVTPTENGILLPGITKYGYRNVQTPVPMSKCGGKVESAKCGCKAKAECGVKLKPAMKCGGKTRKKK